MAVLNQIHGGIGKFIKVCGVYSAACGDLGRSQLIIPGIGLLPHPRWSPVGEACWIFSNHSSISLRRAEPWRKTFLGYRKTGMISF